MTATMRVAKRAAAAGLSKATKARISSSLANARGDQTISTRTGFPSRCLGIVIFAANAFRRWEFVVRAPGEQPSFHVLVLDVVPRLYLTICLTNLCKHSFLVSDVRLDCIGNKEVRTST